MILISGGGYMVIAGFYNLISSDTRHPCIFQALGGGTDLHNPSSKDLAVLWGSYFLRIVSSGTFHLVFPSIIPLTLLGSEPV